MSEILVGKGDKPIYLLAKYANRHGTGKSVSLMVLAEGFSKLGVPVFLADVKGDLAGLAMAGAMNDKLKARIDKLGIEWSASADPVVFWDIYGKYGHPVRTTISEMGPTLLGRLMELNDTQQGVLEIVFKAADENGLLLLDIKDLRALLSWAVDNAKDISQHYGLVAPTSIAAIQRGVLSLEQNGGASPVIAKVTGMPDATWEDLQYEIYVRQAVEAGLKDSREGRTVSLEEARSRFGLKTS